MLDLSPPRTNFQWFGIRPYSLINGTAGSMPIFIYTLGGFFLFIYTFGGFIRAKSQIYYPYPDFFPTGRLSATLKGVSIVPNQPPSQSVNSCLSKCVFSVCTVKIYLIFIHRMYSTYVKFLSLRNFCI